MSNKLFLKAVKREANRLRRIADRLDPPSNEDEDMPSVSLSPKTTVVPASTLPSGPVLTVASGFELTSDTFDPVLTHAGAAAGTYNYDGFINGADGGSAVTDVSLLVHQMSAFIGTSGTGSFDYYVRYWPVGGTNAVDGVNTNTITVNYDLGVVVTGGGTVRQNLVASKCNRGYGKDVVYAANEVVVSNAAQYQAAVQVADNFVVLDSSLAGQNLVIDQEFGATNVTIFGTEAPGCTIRPSGPADFLMPFTNKNGAPASNTILFNLLLDDSGDDIAAGLISLQLGAMSYIYGCEVRNGGDDAISLGSPGASDSLDLCTIDHTRVLDGNKGLLTKNKYSWFAEGHPGTRLLKVSVVDSYVGCSERNPRVAGSAMDMVNVYIEPTDHSGASAISRGTIRYTNCAMHDNGNLNNNNQELMMQTAEHTPTGSNELAIFNAMSIARQAEVIAQSQGSIFDKGGNVYTSVAGGSPDFDSFSRGDNLNPTNTSDTDYNLPPAEKDPGVYTIANPRDASGLKAYIDSNAGTDSF